jgi:hypothetical protein
MKRDGVAIWEKVEYKQTWKTKWRDEKKIDNSVFGYLTGLDKSTFGEHGVHF